MGPRHGTYPVVLRCAVLLQFVGHLDEVLDLQLMGEGESLLAVATNSEQLKVFDRGNRDCQVLEVLSEYIYIYVYPLGVG